MEHWNSKVGAGVDGGFQNQTCPWQRDSIPRREIFKTQHAPGMLFLKMVPSGGVTSNQNRDSNLAQQENSNSLFRALDEWNAILDGMQNPSTRKAADNLPQTKARPSPPVRRRHKKMGSKA
jgi:hypothetical protein